MALTIIGSGCATYHVTTPEGWTADIRTTRKLENATVRVAQDGTFEVDLGGVSYPDFRRYLPYPVPYPAPMQHRIPEARGL